MNVYPKGGLDLLNDEANVSSDFIRYGDCIGVVQRLPISEEIKCPSSQNLIQLPVSTRCPFIVIK